jgi:hypothetical protein
MDEKEARMHGDKGRVPWVEKAAGCEHDRRAVDTQCSREILPDVAPARC